MNHSDQERQDQRTNSGLEDSTAMTIEFLRARLLSERSVSRSARQRADELAKRVAELEEQLRIVFLQRMRAEKATADVLAILESNGISDASETYGSNSDQDIPSESKVGTKPYKEEENSINSKVGKNELEELSVSDCDFSSLRSRSLSWKGRKDNSRYLAKYKDPSQRRQGSFSSVGSSPKHRQGKSCRQIRRRESKPVAEEYDINAIKVDSAANGVATNSEACPNCSDIAAGITEEVVLRGVQKASMVSPQSGYVENEQNADTNEPDYNFYGRGRDMEKALEQQAELIDRYEEMEKAQREWEEKFRENNSSTPDSCDPGNRSDITEERYEIKAEAHDATRTVASETHRAKLEGEDISGVHLNGMLRTADVAMECLQDQNGSTPVSDSQSQDFALQDQNGSTPVSDSQSQDFAFPKVKVRHGQEGSGNNNHQQSDSRDHHLNSQVFHDSPASQHGPSIPSNTASSSSKDRVIQNEAYALVPQKGSDGLGGVLEALRKARLSLQQEINNLPSLESGSIRKSVETSMINTIPRDKVDIPGGFAGLFRLPTDFSDEVIPRVNLFSSSARLSLGNYYPDTAARNFFVSSPALETRPRLAVQDQFLANQYVEAPSRISAQQQFVDPNFDAGLPPSSRFTYPTYPINSSNAHPRPQMPQAATREGFLTFRPGRTVGIPPTDYVPAPDNHMGPNMYR